MKNHRIFPIVLLAVLSACESGISTYDASGAFEADEYLIPSEVTGKLLTWEVREGDLKKEGELVGYVDSTQWVLQRDMLESQIDAVLSRQPNVALQLAALETQLETARSEEGRIGRLVAQGALPSKQLDDLKASIAVLEDRINGLNSQLMITSQGVQKDARTLRQQIRQLDENIRRCTIINPVKGRVLDSYVKQHEMAMTGRPLYKVADLEQMILRVYVTGDQLPELKVGQDVQVFTDAGDGKMHEGSGTISWISDKAEFTPKTIQTKDERANLVYAVKIDVANDGRYKIGMYGEVVW